MENSNFKKGDRVVCINASFSPSILAEFKNPISLPRFMEIYTIRDFYDKSIYLEEIVNPILEPCFYKWRFIKLFFTEEEEKELCTSAGKSTLKMKKVLEKLTNFICTS